MSRSAAARNLRCVFEGVGVNRIIITITHTHSPTQQPELPERTKNDRENVMKKYVLNQINLVMNE